MNTRIFHRFQNFKFIPVVALLALGIVSVYSAACTRTSTVTANNTSSSTSPKADVFTCPMHPQIKKDKPGSCPICGMNLIKVEHSESQHAKRQAEPASTKESTNPEGHAAFKLSPVRGQMIGVKLGVVEKKPLFKTIRAAGRLAFDPELYTAQNEYLEAQKQMNTVSTSPLKEVKNSAKRMLESTRLRLKILGLSDKQIAGLSESSGGNASLLLNKAGQDAWVYADVYEMDLPLMKPGLSAEISAGFLGGQTLAGKVISVDRVINPATRTAKVRILISDARALLRPESYVDVDIHSPLGEQIAVPFDAILDTGRQSWVFVSDGKGNYEPRLVTMKFRAGPEVAIMGGLTEGEQIVVSANFLIDSESRLRGAMAPPEHAGHEGGEAKEKRKVPSCPNGQHWDDPMKMCMPDIGG